MAREPLNNPRATDPRERALAERERELGVYDEKRSDYDRSDARADIRQGHESLDKSEGYDARGNRAGDAYTPRDRRPRDVAYAEREAGYGGPATTDPDQLQDEIELLQNRMAARLDRVTEALTPQNIIAQVTGEKNPDIFTTVDTIADAARRNPLAAGLIGSGIAALLMGTRSKPRYEPDPTAVERQRAAYGVEGVTADGTRFAPSGVEGSTERDEGDYAADGYPNDPLNPVDPGEPSTPAEAERRVRALQDVTAARLDRATNAIGDAYERGRAGVVDTYERMRERFTSDRRDDGYVRPGPADWVRENPVTIGLGALALGALAAGYYTSSRPEPRRTARRPIPSDRALTVRDDYRSVEDEYVRAGEPERAPMPVSAATPAPMSGAMTRTAPIGGSGQIATGASVAATTGASVAASPTITPSGGTSTDRGSASATSSPKDASSPKDTSPPKDGDTAEQIVRRAARQSGTGFGSTAASRGEVASKPLAEQQNTTERESSSGSTPSTVHDAKADGAKATATPGDASTGASPVGGASSERSGTGASATDRTLSRMAGDTETSPSPRERDHSDEPRSDATVEMTDVYRREG